MAVYYKWIKGCAEDSTLNSGLWSYISWANNGGEGEEEGLSKDASNNLPTLRTRWGRDGEESSLGYFLTNEAVGIEITQDWSWSFNKGLYFSSSNDKPYYIKALSHSGSDVLYIGQSATDNSTGKTMVGTNYFIVPESDTNSDVFAVRGTNRLTSCASSFVIGKETKMNDSLTIDDQSIKILLKNTGEITAQGKIESCNSVYAPYFNATSDMRAKENIKKLPFSALSFINNLSVYQFNYKDKKDTVPGVLAQDVLNCQPEGLSLVDNIDASGENGDYMSIKEDKFIFLLMRAVQELKEDNDALRYEIEQLKQKLK